MDYFATLPKVIATKDGVSTIAVDILSRAKIREDISRAESLSYQYDMREGDTPDMIASKYYDSSSRYWIFLYGNNVIDPQWDCGMDDSVFLNYLKDKYGNDDIDDVLAYCHGTVHEYYKTIEKYDSLSEETTKERLPVNKDEYESLPAGVEVEKYFPSGNYVRVIYDKEAESIYDFEYNENLKKRRVNIIKDSYAVNLENQLKTIYK